MNAVVDLRVGSPTNGQYALLELNTAKANSIYIPKWIAQDFCVRSEQAIMVSKVSTMESPAHDTGVLLNSVGTPLSLVQPCISDRNKNFSDLADFKSPFLI
jgi:dTDP-4-dehydrorhamnose 3,5-epimerase